MTSKRPMPSPPSSRSGHAPPNKRRREHANAEGDEFRSDDEGLACQSCRKRKAKCSKQQPCSQCQRLGVVCTYEERRRPGMKTGAVEALNQRMTALEHMFVGQGLLLRPLLARNTRSTTTTDNSIQHDWEGDDDDETGDESTSASLNKQSEKLKQHYLAAISKDWQGDAPGYGSTQAARPAETKPQNTELSLDMNILPDEDILESLVEWYFTNVHRWIPILHRKKFRELMRVHPRSPGLNNILHAITSLSLKFHFPHSADATLLSVRCRNVVILRSMEQISVENVQALVIVAFDIIASGQSPSAWSIVGTIARTAEQLRLSREELDDQSSKSSGQYLMRRMNLLRPAKTWADEEERRRVFWTVFTMDRFCTIATGWNNSLTTADVQRRLPCEGALWEAGIRVETPFFGIAERSKPQETLIPTSERCSANDDEVDAIGGFAFCIEATETLNLVTSFFLDYPVTAKNSRQAELWLIRFRELDLRLIKWRSFLPPRWRNASVLNQDGLMDPNLTLAHVTHNTAVIQLHQNIAFPSGEWRGSQVSLPTAGSLNTCITAACEIGSISHQFMQQNTGVTNPQLSFCLFIAGRVLLVHANTTGESLHPAFDVILSALSATAKLWTTNENARDNGTGPGSLASRLSERLAKARETLHCSTGTNKSTSLDMHQSIYCEDTNRSRAVSPSPVGVGVIGTHHLDNHPSGPLNTANNLVPNDHVPELISMAFPPLPLSFQQFSPSSGAYQQYEDAMATSLGEGIIGDGLDDLFNSQYEQVTRVSAYTDPFCGNNNH